MKNRIKKIEKQLKELKPYSDKYAKLLGELFDINGKKCREYVNKHYHTNLKLGDCEVLLIKQLKKLMDGKNKSEPYCLLIKRIIEDIKEFDYN